MLKTRRLRSKWPPFAWSAAVTAKHRAARSALSLHQLVLLLEVELHLAVCRILQWSSACHAACYKPSPDICRALEQTSDMRTSKRTQCQHRITPTWRPS